jgi:hypothetical protein
MGEDIGQALELLLNERFKLFHTAITSDRGTHEFLIVLELGANARESIYSSTCIVRNCTELKTSQRGSV